MSIFGELLVKMDPRILARRLCGRNQDEEPPEEPLSRVSVNSPEEIRRNKQQKDLFKAIESCDLQRIKEFKEELQSFKNIKDNVHGRTCLHVLADLKPKTDNDIKDENLYEVFKVLIEAGCDVNCADEFGNTPVKLAAEKGCLQVLHCLLEENANVDTPDKHKGDTPLHWAAKNGKDDAIKLLLAYKPHLNPQNSDKKTPLHLAVKEKHTKIVWLLLLSGADKMLKDKNEFTPLCIAERDGSMQIIDLLGKSEQELYDMFHQNKSGLGEYVESDSGSSSNTIPWLSIKPAAPVHLHFDIILKDQSVAAIGPNSRVELSGQNTAVSKTSMIGLPGPLPPKSTALQGVTSTPSLSPTTPEPSASLSPTIMDKPPPLRPANVTSLPHTTPEPSASLLPTIIDEPPPLRPANVTSLSRTKPEPSAPLSPTITDEPPPLRPTNMASATPSFPEAIHTSASSPPTPRVPTAPPEEENTSSS